jgi:hypothetical protein
MSDSVWRPRHCQSRVHQEIGELLTDRWTLKIDRRLRSHVAGFGSTPTGMCSVITISFLIVMLKVTLKNVCTMKNKLSSSLMGFVEYVASNILAGAIAT